MSFRSSPQSASMSEVAVPTTVASTPPANIPPLPPASIDPLHALHSKWETSFSGFLCGQGGHFVAETGEQRDKDGDVDMSFVGQKQPFITEKYLNPVLEVNTIRMDGNCYFASVASIVYGTSEVWVRVKAQHQVFVEGVIADKEHPRHAMYKRWFSCVGDRSLYQRHKTNGVRLMKSNEYQSATTLQVAADMYGVMFAVLQQAEGIQETVRGVKIQPLRVTALYGHPKDPVRLLYFDPGIQHFMGVRPTTNAHEAFEEYTLPPSLLSAARPWKEFQLGGKSSSGILERIPRLSAPEPSANDILRAHADTKLSATSDNAKIALPVECAAASTTVAAGSETTTSTPVRFSSNQLAPPEGHLQRSITDWRHPRPPHKFWDQTCSFSARQEDKRLDQKNLAGVLDSAMQDAVKDIEELELLSMEEGYEFSEFMDNLAKLLRRAVRFTGVPEEPSPFDKFARLMGSRIRRLKNNYLDRTAKHQFKVVVEAETSQLRSEKVATLLRLGLYLLVRFHLHQTGKILADEGLSQQLKELHSKI